MKTIIGVIFLVFIIIIGMNAIESERILFYDSLGISDSDHSSSYSFDADLIFSVTISGEVKKSGIYEIENGGFLEDIIEQAGGLTDKADDGCFNYYLQIVDNIEIYIPPKSDNAKISLNDADEDEFLELVGVGRVLASRIIEYRDSNGKFLYLEQLMNVSGIGKSIFNKIKDNICL